MSEEIRVTFSCKKCGSHALTVADKSNDASPVICSSCGTVAGTWGEAKVAALQQTMPLSI